MPENTYTRYTMTSWLNGSTKLNQDNMNHIEQGIYDASVQVLENLNNLDLLKTWFGGNFPTSGTVNNYLLKDGGSIVSSEKSLILINHSNEFNFIPEGYDTPIYINYQPAHLRNNTGNITSYVFLKGNGRIEDYANIYGGTIYSNGVACLTQHQSLANYVTLDGTQTITGNKTFSSATTISALLTLGNSLKLTSANKISFYNSTTPTTEEFKIYKSNNYYMLETIAASQYLQLKAQAGSYIGIGGAVALYSNNGTIVVENGNTSSPDYKILTLKQNGKNTILKISSSANGNEITFPTSTGTVALLSNKLTDFAAETNKNKWLHTNATTGVLEWVTLEGAVQSAKLNGTTTSNPEWYAPTGSGSAGQFLISVGSGAPQWGNTLPDGSYIRVGTQIGAGNKGNYLSAGAGYSNGSGYEGVKVVCCDQTDCVSGLGQDLGSNTGKSIAGYNLSLAGCNNPADKGSISFVTHVKGNTTYRELGYFDDNTGTVKFVVNGNMYASQIGSTGAEIPYGYFTTIQCANLINVYTLKGRFLGATDGYIESGYVTTMNSTTTNSTTVNATYVGTSSAACTGVYSAAFYATSDRRLKENITNVSTSLLDIIKKLDIHEYNFIGSEKTTVGAIAQELQEILPEKYRAALVEVGKDGDQYLSINEGKLGYITIGAVKELNSKVESLEAKLAALEEKLNRLVGE